MEEPVIAVFLYRNKKFYEIMGHAFSKSCAKRSISLIGECGHTDGNSCLQSEISPAGVGGAAVRDGGTECVAIPWKCSESTHPRSGLRSFCYGVQVTN